MTAEVGIAFKGLKQSFVTYNTHIADRELRIQLVKGPFSTLNGLWTFTPVGQAGERACRVTLALDYGFDSKALSALVGPVFDKIAATMVDAFIQRAEQVYGLMRLQPPLMRRRQRPHWRHRRLGQRRAPGAAGPPATARRRHPGAGRAGQRPAARAA